MNIRKLEKLQSLANEMVATGFVAGVSCMVLHQGKEVCYYQAGLRDMESNLPMTRDTICRMYSMSKPVTSAAVMLLLEEGKIDLLANVADYLPGFSNPHTIQGGVPVPSKKPVTIKDLLHMTSGVAYPGESNPAEVRVAKLMDDVIARMDTEEAYTTYEFMNALGKLPLAFEPGTIWQYGFSADVLGAVVEVVSGMGFGEFLKKRIFEPLGMEDTGFYVPEEKQSRLAKLYRGYPDGLREDTYPNLGISNRMQYAPAFESGGAGLASTIDDYARFATMLLQKGSFQGQQILSPETVKFMTTAHVNEVQQKGVDTWESLAGYSYGNLLRIMTRPDQAAGICSPGEYGWDGWLGTYVMNDPAHELTFIMMQQKADTGTTEYSRRMRNVVFSALEH
ncbi:MAG: serine hydrolase domain-containing protein [Lachnospiraceae bacterium]|nr:serine hydrolase [Clostridiales bacterium]MDY3110610.1 serine hydrolase domain-containing protein [Lachnospiraceae bacterium]